MANVFNQIDEIAQNAYFFLENNLVLSQTIKKEYTSEFSSNKKGSTIQIPRMQDFTAQEFVPNPVSQDIKEYAVPLTLEKYFEQRVTVTAREAALNVNDFSELVVAPQMRSIAQKVDEYLAKKIFQSAYRFAGVAGSPPASVSEYTQLVDLLDDAKGPVLDRYLACDPRSRSSIMQIPTFIESHKRGSDDPIKRGEVGELMGIVNLMSQNIQRHIRGDADVATKIATAIVVDPNNPVNTINLKDCGAGVIKKGDLFTVAGSTQSFTVINDANIVAGDATITVSPTVQEDLAVDAVLTFVDTHVANLLFCRDAVTFASVAPEAPDHGAIVNHKGLGLSMNRSWDHGLNAHIFSVSTLVGCAVIEPELVVRVLG